MVNTIKGFLTSNRQAQMVVAIVTSKRKDRYDAIKRLCCLDMPVPSQVVTSQIIEDAKKAKSVVTKVAIQMNCKLGGELWLTKIPVSSINITILQLYLSFYFLCSYFTYYSFLFIFYYTEFSVFFLRGKNFIL